MMKKTILFISLQLTFLSLTVCGNEIEFPKPLNEKDLKLYTEIFSLQKDGKFKLADNLIDKLDSRILLGRVKAQRYLHPTAYISKFSELKKWLEIYEVMENIMVSEKKIHPNLDFPSGPAYYLMGFPINLYTPIFVMARITGWSAHYFEQNADNSLIRPLSAYVGKAQRKVKPLVKRK